MMKQYRLAKGVNFMALAIFILMLLPCCTRKEFTNSMGMNMVRIEPGTFMMGSTPGEDWQERDYEGPFWDEYPPHLVTLTNTFYISTTEITNLQYEQFDPGHKKYRGRLGYSFHDDDPVMFVSWHDAMAFCTWLSKKEGKHYRLPMEAEWEYACRAGTTTPYHMGETYPEDDLEFPNPWGLYDMHGGVAEWCLDWWSPYEPVPVINPAGPSEGNVRILRGGTGGRSERTYMRSSTRKGTVPDDKYELLGFRVVMGKLPAKRHHTQVTAPEAFTGVNQEDALWTPDPGHPYFSGGVRYLEVPGDSAPFPYFNRTHVPSITWCPNGDLLATAFTAPFDISRQMAMLISRLRHGNDRWDPPALFFFAPGHNVTSAVLYNAGDGEIHHYNGIASPRELFTTIKRISKDNGATWSIPRIVHERPEDPAFLMKTLGEPPSDDNTSDDQNWKKDFQGEPRFWPHMDMIRLSDGILVMPSDCGGSNKRGTVLWKSGDNGDNWSQMTRYGWNPHGYAREGEQSGWIAGIHAPIVELNDGSLLAIGRHSNIQGRSPMSLSQDHGKTWTYFPSEFPPIYSGQLPLFKRLNDGSILLVSFTDLVSHYRDRIQKGIDVTDASGKKQKAYGLFSALSFDEGKTWHHKKPVPIDINDPRKTEIWGYLSCVQTPDNMIHMVTSNYYYRFNTAWLKEPMP
jgi:formylglycine-generating enzyme